MSMKIFAIALFGAIPLFAGEPVKVEKLTVNGREYSGVTITQESRLTAKISHDAGIARVNIADIPEDVRIKLSPQEKAPLSLPEETVSVSQLDQSGKEFAAVYSGILEKENDGFLLKDVTVIQTVSENFKLAKFGPDADTIMLLGDTTKRADGATFRAYVKDTGRIQSYQTVFGASKNVVVYEFNEQISKFEFVKILKIGVTYTIQLGEGMVVCPKCNGEPIPCSTCGSTGKILQKKTVHVQW